MSPRPKKPRICCPYRAPGSLLFKPAGTPVTKVEQVILERDELEALRLCDFEALSQQQAGEQMGISRGTVQRLVSTGRKKIMGALLSGRALVVLGDDLELQDPRLN